MKACRTCGVYMHTECIPVAPVDDLRVVKSGAKVEAFCARCSRANNWAARLGLIRRIVHNKLKQELLSQDMWTRRLAFEFLLAPDLQM